MADIADPSTGSQNYGSMWFPSGDSSNPWNAQGDLPSNLFNSSEAINADKRSLYMQQQAQSFNSSEALKNRQWEEAMSNTAMQRRLADLKASGFSPLALLGSQGASSPSGTAAHSGSASGTAARDSGSASRLLSGIISVIGGIITSGMSSAAKVAASTSAAAIEGAHSSVSMDKDVLRKYARIGSFQRALDDGRKTHSLENGVMSESDFKKLIDGIGHPKR